MSYVDGLHSAHKARRAKLWPETPKGPGGKSFEVIVAEKDYTIQQQQAMIESLQGEINQLRGSVESLRWTVKAGAFKPEQQESSAFREPLPVTIANIIAVTCRHFGVSYGEMIGARRTLEVVLPRQIAMYLAKKLTLKSMPEIGRRMGGRDHTTILHAYRKINGMVRDGSPIITDIAVIRAMLVVTEPPT